MVKDRAKLARQALMADFRAKAETPAVQAPVVDAALVSPVEATIASAAEPVVTPPDFVVTTGQL